MKVIEVPVREKKPKRTRTTQPREPKVIKTIREKLYLPPPARKSQKKSIGLFGIWSVAFWGFFLSSPEANMREFLFYYGFLSILVINALLFMRKRESDEVKEETQMDIPKALPAMMLWGGLIFGLNFFLIVGSGNQLVAPSTFEILRQLIVVVPCETFIFIVYLPPILDWGIASRIPWVPGWLYAQIIFGMFHVISGAMPIELGIFAVLMGCIWFVIYSLRKMPKYGKYFGVAAVMSWHFTHNLMAIAVETITADPLVVLFKLMGL